MTAEEWRRIEMARQTLGLDEKATLAEIKRAFRTLSKKHHPDGGGSGATDGDGVAVMRELITAYEILLEYCARYRFPLVRGRNEPLQGEDWWMERFGDDPLWGPGRVRENQED